LEAAEDGADLRDARTARIHVRQCRVTCQIVDRRLIVTILKVGDRNDVHR
jgi:mRNA-degrading endonuclease RelE of RelBE toxin-antitoxin system